MPIRDERGMFERLSLEAFQSGLSWATILRKRPAFRRAFADFDPDAVAGFTETTSSGCSPTPGSSATGQGPRDDHQRAGDRRAAAPTAGWSTSCGRSEPEHDSGTARLCRRSDAVR